MSYKTLLLPLLFVLVLLSAHAIALAEEGSIQDAQSTAQTGQKNEEQILQEKVQGLQSEIRNFEDRASYGVLKGDLEKVQKDVNILEMKMKDNESLKQSQEEQKKELETRLQIRERQLSGDPDNPDVKNEVDSIRKQIDGENGVGGLNVSILELNKKIEADRLLLEEATPKRDRLQQEFDAHPLTKKQQELDAAEKELINLRNKNQHERLVQRLNEMNKRTSTFDVKKYLSVGHESEISIVSEDNSNNDLISRLIRLAIQSLGTFAILMMIVAGYFMITSEGDENRIQKGKNIFLYTIIGLLVAFSSYALVQLVLSVIFQ